jgi:NADPH-dependent ferric siderophore reductase
MTIMHDSPTTISGKVPRWTDARDQMIHACALQEHFIATGPVLPSEVKVVARDCLVKGYKFPTDEIDLDVYLHHNVAGVWAYQAQFGGEITTVPRGDGMVCVRLAGREFGCSFVVWSLDSAEAAAA